MLRGKYKSECIEDSNLYISLNQYIKLLTKQSTIFDVYIHFYIVFVEIAKKPK